MEKKNESHINVDHLPILKRNIPMKDTIMSIILNIFNVIQDRNKSEGKILWKKSSAVQNVHQLLYLILWIHKSSNTQRKPAIVPRLFELHFQVKIPSNPLWPKAGHLGGFFQDHCLILIGTGTTLTTGGFLQAGWDRCLKFFVGSP